MVKAIKVMLVPNNVQRTKMFQYAGASRFAYNWALAKENENHKKGGKFISDSELRKEFTKLRNSDEYAWLQNVSNNVTKQAIKDACTAYKNFFKGLQKYPRFKSKKKSTPRFYQDNVKIQFSNTHVKFEGFSSSRKANKRELNWVRLAELGRIPTDAKYMNPRISFDGLSWWISVCVEFPNCKETLNDEGIGVDLGIKDLAICSDSTKYKNINKSQTVKKLEKRKRRLQRSVSRKYEQNKGKGKYCKTHNVIKKEKLLLKEKICDGRGNLSTDYFGSRLIESDEIYFMCITKTDILQIEDIQLSGGVVVLTDKTLMRPDELSRYTEAEMEYLNAQINLCRVFHAGNIGFRDVFFTYQHNTLGIKNTFNNNSHNQTRNVIDNRKWQLSADEVADANRWLSDYAGAPYQLLKNGIDEFSWGLEQIDLATGFEKYTTTLEMILLEKNATGKKQKLANRVSVFIGADNANITALHQKMINYYRFRSESLHEGDGSNISDVELKELEAITRSVVKETLVRCRLAYLKNPAVSWDSIKKEIISDLVSQITTLKSVGVLPN